MSDKTKHTLAQQARAAVVAVVADAAVASHSDASLPLAMESAVRDVCTTTSLEVEDIDALLELLHKRLGERAASIDRARLLHAASLSSHVQMRAVPETDLLQRRDKVLGAHLKLFFAPQRPARIVRGEGVSLIDEHGRRYTDCYNNVVSVGHCHPHVVSALARQARRLNTNTRYLTEESVLYAERLRATFPPELDTVLFVNTGSEANDVAIRMARAYTGHTGGICSSGAYHGITEAVAWFTPKAFRGKTQPPPHMRYIHAPERFRGPFKEGADLGERYAALVDEPIAELQRSGHGVALCLFDSLFTSDGIVDAPLDYLPRVAARVRAAGGLYVADEVQSGFGRTGQGMWGYQRFPGLIPDIVTIGKPAGNGHPIGAIVTRKEILDRFTAQWYFFSTFGGNNVSCSVGLAVLDVIHDERLIENARVVGAHFLRLLRALQQRHPFVGDVRGVGLSVGVEIVDPVSQKPSEALCLRLLPLMRDEGVLAGPDGFHNNVVKMRPPLVFSNADAERAAASMDRALTRLAQSPKL